MGIPDRWPGGRGFEVKQMVITGHSLGGQYAQPSDWRPWAVPTGAGFFEFNWENHGKMVIYIIIMSGWWFGTWLDYDFPLPYVGIS